MNAVDIPPGNRCIFIVRVIQQRKDDFCAHRCFIAGVDGVAFHAFGTPFVSGIRAIGFGAYCNSLCNHKCRVESNAELTDDIRIVIQGVFGFEYTRA